MSDYSVLSEAGAFELQFWRLAGQLRVCLPGNIVSFDAATQRCVARPGVKLKLVDGANVSYMEMPDIQNVPIVVPYAQGAGLLLTLPIQAGDPCLLLFSDRALDNFLQRGESEIPGTAQDADVTSPRVHHLTDAICIPGLITNTVTVPSWSTSNIELRDKERKNYISIGPDGITITDGSAKWQMNAGKVTLNAPSGITETTTTASRVASGVNKVVGSNISLGAGGTDTVTNSLKSTNGTFIDKNGRDSTSHKHSGVQTGSGTSGATVA